MSLHCREGKCIVFTKQQTEETLEGLDIISKPTDACKCTKVHCTQCIPPTCFGHSYDHLQGGALQRTDASKYYRSFSADGTDISYQTLKIMCGLKDMLKVKVQIKIFCDRF